MKLPSDYSWTMRKLFKLRELSQDIVKHIIGDGQDTFFWFDNWHPSGPLYKLLDDKAVATLDGAIFGKASSVIHDGYWNWPRPRFTLIQPQRDRNDEVVWTASPNGQYTTKHTWDTLRHRGVKVPQASLVWFPNNISKWTFILWVACLNRLATKDRLRRWGMEVDPCCVLGCEFQ